jgi:hypothetical protein
MEQGGAILWAEFVEAQLQWEGNSDLWYKEDKRKLKMTAKVHVATFRTL